MEYRSLSSLSDRERDALLQEWLQALERPVNPVPLERIPPDVQRYIMYTYPNTFARLTPLSSTINGLTQSRYFYDRICRAPITYNEILNVASIFLEKRKSRLLLYTPLDRLPANIRIDSSVPLVYFGQANIVAPNSFSELYSSHLVYRYENPENNTLDLIESRGIPGRVTNPILSSYSISVEPVLRRVYNLGFTYPFLPFQYLILSYRSVCRNIPNYRENWILNRFEADLENLYKLYKFDNGWDVLLHYVTNILYAFSLTPPVEESIEEDIAEEPSDTRRQAMIQELIERTRNNMIEWLQAHRNDSIEDIIKIL